MFNLILFFNFELVLEIENLRVDPSNTRDELHLYTRQNY